MRKTIVLAAVVALGLSSLASAVFVDFETAGDQNLFPGGGNSFTRVAGHGGNMARLETGNNTQFRVYTPSGGYTMGAGTISADMDLTYGGTAGATYSGGLMLQQKAAGEQYEVFVNLDSGTPKMYVGNYNQWGYNTGGHTGPVSVSLSNDTFTAATSILDLGWWNINAVVGTDGSNHYKVDVTLTSPSSHTYTTTYIDTGASQYTTAYPVGLYGMAQYGAPVNFDNFSIVPEPATMALLALGGLAMLRRRHA